MADKKIRNFIYEIEIRITKVYFQRISALSAQSAFLLKKLENHNYQF